MLEYNTPVNFWHSQRLQWLSCDVYTNNQHEKELLLCILKRIEKICITKLDDSMHEFYVKLK